ncbi:MAG: YidC/Oxa1 family membrane protein insertase [Rubrobacteraceae bacterium]|nr:membrane protein insertase YidC [Rubrobacter sp.]
MTDFLGNLFAPLTNLMGGALEAFHTLGAPWWLSIVLLTLVVRGFLFPLTVKQVKNARAMQELKPEMDEIRRRHKDNRQKQQEAIMELYKERRMNPLAGFLPLLVQMPVFITMYRVIRHFEETLRGFDSGGLLWFTNLTAADPYFILPVVSASIMVLAGEVSSKNVNPAQKRMMRFLPLVFTVFIARFPAGLFVYWITSNTFTLVQNLLIYRPGQGRPVTDPAEPITPSKPPEETRSQDSSGQTNGTSNQKAKASRRRRKRKKKR